MDYSYLDLLFDNQQEADNFLRIFVKELEQAKLNVQQAITRRNVHLYRQTLHNVSPHLEMLKIAELSALLLQTKEKMIDTRQVFEDKQVFISAINKAFEKVINDIHSRLSQQ